ncbi:hypothetical protein M9Y10_037586 [Tritrichomonas musculus]|uniref:Uncharacterized protein n=1 Tax=Tritrichomonas musculus TaxID=1915356 RepID=A0ABR2GRW5_9EUKA
MEPQKLESNDILLKEINLNKTRTDATFKLKAIGNKKIKHETLLYNLNKIINCCDVSYVNYTQGGKNIGEDLQPLNNLFSDNIIVYYPIEDKLITDIEKLKGKVSNASILDEDAEEVTPPSLNKIAKDLLGGTTATIKMLFNQIGLEIKKPDIKPIGIRKTENFKYKPSTFVQLLKVNLSYCNVNNIFTLLEDEEKMQFLHDNKVFIHDIDFTRDYKGVFNKEDVIKHLINNHNFVQEGDGNPDKNPVIISNSRYVSNNCLTFLRNTEIGLIRYKFYNKFVQSMESPSVRNKIGSHINDWINNPEPILRDSIEKSLETGLLRLEFTCYVYSEEVVNKLTKEDVIEEMEYLHNLMSPELIYYNPIQNQFNLLCDNILYNICIIDVDQDLAFISLYHNKLTGKVNGFYLEKINVTKLSNALRWYCSNKPIIVILMHLDSANDEVNIQQDCYIRVSNTTDKLFTYICKGSEKLKAVQKIGVDWHKPEDMGLIPNNVFNFTYPSTNPSLLKSSSKEAILFKPFDMELLNYPNEAITIRSVNKELREATSEKNFMQNYEKKIDLIKEKNAAIVKQMEKSNRKEMVRNKLYKLLSNIRAYSNKFVDLEDGTEIYVYGVKEANTRYGETFLLACSTDNCILEGTELKLYWATTNINHYIRTIIGNFKQLDIKGINSYGSLTGIPLLSLIKECNFYNASKNLCAKVIVKGTTGNKEEDISRDKNSMEILEGVNIKQCTKIDDAVKEGDIIKVTGFRKLKSSLIIKCSINDGEPNNYVCTYWLKQIILDRIGDNETTNNLNAIVGVSKTTPQKQKALIYVVS